MFSADEPEYCPLCHELLTVRPRVRLSGVPVCRKCRRTFVLLRIGAVIFDIAVLYILPVTALNLILNWWGMPINPTRETVQTVIGYVLLLVIMLKDGLGGVSPGKVLLGLEVRNVHTGRRIGLWQSFRRNWAIYLIWPFAIFEIVELFRGRRSGDEAAGTIVIWCRYADRLPFQIQSESCQECGYNLTGNVSGVCPECGTAIPPGRRTAATARP